MKTLLKNLRYLWNHDLLEDVCQTLDDVDAKAKSYALDLVPVQSTTTEILIKGGTSTLPQVLGMSVGDFFRTDRVSALTSRAINLAGCNRIETVSQLTNWTAKELLKTGNIGIKTVGYIQYMLAKHGLKLAGDA